VRFMRTVPTIMYLQSGAKAKMSIVKDMTKVSFTTMLLLPTLSARGPPISWRSARAAKEADVM